MAGDINQSTELCEHSFQDNIAENNVYFKTLRMRDSIFIWIGDNPSFDLLTISTPTKMSSIPSSSTILGEDNGNIHGPMAQRLAKKLKKQILLSLNMTANEETYCLIEKKLFEEFQKYPERF